MRAAILLALALVGLALPAAAAGDQFYVQTGDHGQRRRLAPGESTEVATAGNWKLKAKLAGRRGTTRAACVESGGELVGNVSGTVATAQTTALALACSGGVVATAVLLPWSGELTGDCQPCKLSRPMSLEVSVGGVSYGTFSGTVAGQLGDFDDPIKDELDHTWKWLGAKGGKLVNGAGSSITLAGQDSWGVEGDRACGETNAGAVVEEGEDGT